MSDDSSDCSDLNLRPSGSKGRQYNRSDQKRKRRIVMRIEFDDSDGSASSASDRTSDDDDGVKNKNNCGNGIGANDLNENGPSCSHKLRNRQKKNCNDADNDNDDSDEFQRNAARRLRRGGRRFNVLNVGFSDDSSSGSEITHHKISRGKKYVLSEEERELSEQNLQETLMDEQGFSSDSSSNELLEKCPICLITFRQQEIGSPSTCEHIFCAKCIEAWSRNVQTCPIDRIEFQRIIVRESYEKRNIVRDINVDPNAKKELELEEDLGGDEDVTNCEICNRPDREDVMLLCDHCNQGYHMDCLLPPLSEVPEGSWYCDNCVDSADEDDDEEDLNMLYEDIRDMGIPQTRLRVREVQQPRILRTRQNERIRAAILRRTSELLGRLDTTRTIATSSTVPQGRRSHTAMATTTTRRSTATKKSARKTHKRKRRGARQRTYVVEYDLNNFDEKFAIKTTKKVIKRRRCYRKKRISSSKKSKNFASDGTRMTASKRLAEQMGVKRDSTYTSHLTGATGGLSLFGSANDLEYFSDSDNDNVESEIHIDTGHGTAVQTSVRISNYGSQRSRKSLLLGRLQPNRGIQEPVIEQNNAGPDILSSILNMQDRWHSASRNLERVHINSDGTLHLPNSTLDNTSSTSISTEKENKSIQKQSANGIRASDINQAPMYSRGGGSANFNRGGGGGAGGSGGYNNRSNNQNNYRGGGNQYRHSIGSVGSSGVFGGGSSSGSSGGINFSMVGRGNFNFSNNPNYNTTQNQQNNTSPFQQRSFNQRNQPNQNNQRNNNNNNGNQQRLSLPFLNNRSDNVAQQQTQINPYGVGIPQTCLLPTHMLLNQQPQQSLQPPINENSLFAGLPPPMSIPPPHINVNPTVRMSVPPPPAPPPVVIPPPVSSSLFQLTSDYGNNDDDSNCPNFAIYSHESLQVAKSSDIYPTSNTNEGTSNSVNVDKEDDENEDLVQLDDDDEIPMPPDPNPTTNNVGSSELYEPENPTEENDYDEDNSEKSEDENLLNKSEEKITTKDEGDDYGDDNSDDEDDEKKNSAKNKEQMKQNNCERNNTEETSSECTNNIGNDELKEQDIVEQDKNLNNEIDKPTEITPSLSPAISEVRLPENEIAAASRKGVLELYDDSDWEELDIDRPKEYDTKSAEKTSEKEKVDDDGNEDNGDVNEQDRSYTPCLDENNDPEEAENECGSTTPLIEENSVTTRNDKQNGVSDAVIENMGTELISDEENDLDRRNKDRKKSQKSNDKRGDRRENEKVETFKKIGNKQKGRNYRGDKQPLTNNRRNDKKRRSRSRSISRSPSRSADSYHSRGVKSRSRSPRFRGRGNRSRSRSRSRSNNKENQGRWGGNFREGNRFNNRNNLNQPNRYKRRELPRYDVRNVIGHHSPQKTITKDRYGRDTSRNRRSSRSLSRGRRPMMRSSFSRSRSRNRRLSISLSPSPSFSRRRSLSNSRPIRHFSPARRRSASLGRRTPPYRQRSRTPLRVMRSRSISPISDQRLNGRKVPRHLRGGSSPRNINRGRIRTRSISMSPRYTPRLSRSHSKTPRLKGRKKKTKEGRKKKSKRRIAAMDSSPNRRISRQPDPFEIEKPPKKKRRRTSRVKSPILHDDHGWSPSPSPPPQPIVDSYDYQLDKNVSWTPPMQSPLLGLFRPSDVRSDSRASRKEKSKRSKKKKKSAKRRDARKEKKRKRRTETPEPAPSKEVFASGNNILVSVSFNKETTNSQHTQQTIVTLPPNREDLLSNRRNSVERVISSGAPKKRKEKRKKIDTKPVAIIDLERSPFQIEQEPTDIIILTDSEEMVELEQRDHRRDRRHSESCARDVDTETHRNQRSTVNSGQRGEKSPERLDTILEESFDLPQSGGPKTPPEPPIVKFNLQAKKQSKVRNPLHDEDDLALDAELNERQQQQQQENHRSDLEVMHVQSSQKIGPNTPPESGPCSPDAYDPFEPTKSPSISPRSPTPPPSQMDASQNAMCVESAGELGTIQKHLNGIENEQRREQIPGLGGNVAQGASLNPVDLVMALINSKAVANNAQELANKTNDSQHINSMGGVNSHDDPFRDKTDEGNTITVLSNLLISSGNMQHIPSISSPTPPAMSKKILPGLPKIGGSVGGSSSSGINIRNGGVGGTSNNADDSFNMNDIESPYSPGSADYEDLFEPPPDTTGNKRRSKRKPELFDNLFGSSSPVGNMRLPLYTPSKKYRGIAATGVRKSKIKVGKLGDDNIKVYDEVPNSAVELHVKDKFLRKLNRQERVVEEVKMVLKPRFNKKHISKEDYKEIMRRAVPKICHSRSGEIDPFKIKKLIDAYVKKFRAKHKKLNIVNTGQVSSAVKCAAYLKKLSRSRHFTQKL